MSKDKVAGDNKQDGRFEMALGGGKDGFYPVYLQRHPEYQSLATSAPE